MSATRARSRGSEALQFFGHIHHTTLIVGRSSIARASRSFQGLARGRGSEGGDLCRRKGLRSKNDLDVKEIVIFGREGSASVMSLLGRCWNECANAPGHRCLACRHTEPNWL